MPPRKTKPTAPDIEPVPEPELSPIDQPSTSQEDTFTFKRNHFYAVFTVLAFAAGILVGYVAWGYNTGPTMVQAIVQTAPPPEPRLYEISTEGYPSLGPAD